MEVIGKKNRTARKVLATWQKALQKNIYSQDEDFIHTIAFTLPKQFALLDSALTAFGEVVPTLLEPLVNENNLATNLPVLRQYDSLGNRVDEIIHHPSYLLAGDLIYQTGLLGKMLEPQGLTQTLAFLFLSSHAGEAGHNCPIACSAGIIRVLQKLEDFPNRKLYLEKLTTPSIYANFTGAQFLTEIQGGSDVGTNITQAEQVENNVWRIYGEKWFCSNAGADLIFVTARYHPEKEGTKGLALFLVPAKWNGLKNHYIIRRLKDKIGTRSMATGEIDFQGAYAFQIGRLQDSFHLVMENILHLSRLFNALSVLGMARRAFYIAREYAHYRVAFSKPIIQYPLVQETLARIRAENTAMIAGAFATAHLQDELDAKGSSEQSLKLLLRLLVNIMKYFTAHLSVQHIHQSLGVLAGNGAIESFSSIPRLLRDCIVCENWEGTDNVLRIQILKDFVKFDLHQIFLSFLHKEIQQINQGQGLLSKALIKLEQDLFIFKQLSTDQQTLAIRAIVDQMASLFCATMLLKEAIAQQAENGSISKLNCYQLFCALHLDNPQDLPVYMALITQIVAPEKS